MHEILDNSSAGSFTETLLRLLLLKVFLKACSCVVTSTRLNKIPPFNRCVQRAGGAYKEQGSNKRNLRYDVIAKHYTTAVSQLNLTIAAANKTVPICSSFRYKISYTLLI